MNELDVLIGQMVSDIATQAYQLDDHRLRMFLHWLTAHSGRVRTATGIVLDMDIVALRGAEMQGRLRPALGTWLESLPAQGMLWEYHLILDEIAWWRSLDPRRLQMLMQTEAGR